MKYVAISTVLKQVYCQRMHSYQAAWTSRHKQDCNDAFLPGLPKRLCLQPKDQSSLREDVRICSSSRGSLPKFGRTGECPTDLESY